MVETLLGHHNSIHDSRRSHAQLRDVTRDDCTITTTVHNTVHRKTRFCSRDAHIVAVLKLTSHIRSCACALHSAHELCCVL